MRACASILAASALFGLSMGASAQDGLPGMGFSDIDWELACDNTGTCRAAGYSADGAEKTVSILLTRRAGPAQPVHGEVMISRHDENLMRKLPPDLALSLVIDNSEVGSPIAMGAPAGTLSRKQLAAVLVALRGNGRIEFVSGAQRWRLSEKGAATVFLKMDHFQKRLGTRGALLNPGPLGEHKVLRQVPAPVINAVPWAKPLDADAQLASRDWSSLRTALRTTVREIDCPDLYQSDGQATPLSFERLSASRLLAFASCWSTAHNAGRGYWVIGDGADINPVLVTTDGTEHGGGNIVSAQKAHGVGDCWSTEAWTWDGDKFIHTAISSPGFCRAIANGGAWPLPRLVTQVRPAPVR